MCVMIGRSPARGRRRRRSFARAIGTAYTPRGVPKAMAGQRKRCVAFARFRDAGCICPRDTAAERALRGIALGRRSWLFAGSDRGGERAAAMYTLIVTAKLNGIDPQAWLADVLRRIADHPASRLDQLLPWHWKGGVDQAAAA